MHTDFSYQHVVHKVADKGYANILETNDIAIVGWRNTKGRLNKFDCTIGAYFKTGRYAIWPASTYPGMHYMRNPLSSKGVATLVEGQYVDAYSIGSFKGYQALRQQGAVTVIRDANKDDVRNGKYMDVGWFGIHIHKAGKFSKLVGNWSAGCQVFQKSEDFDIFMSICREHSDKVNNKFTYTLLEV